MGVFAGGKATGRIRKRSGLHNLSSAGAQHTDAAGCCTCSKLELLFWSGLFLELSEGHLISFLQRGQTLFIKSQ